ncbi:putative calcium-transporting ATPase 13, plasma membrane-type [Eutrema salsugineum]|uniref:putative calcium-transporting ATPase 13, plasma membrane-type n=1 Tax=Eutrema salsugineum TaxID=72664 RepID=UPI000CECE8AF|nr:putative calcium-transporting ATPase 13, plasma membrane-type [Eutrema salsugineum]
MPTNVPDHAEKKNNLVGVEFLLELPKTLSKSNKKWQLAFIKIYCSRTLLNCAKHTIQKPGLFTRSLSYTTINLDHHQDHHGDFKIDQETLNDLVKNKNQEKLDSLGGPNGLVSALKTNTRLGINEEADEIQVRRSTFGSNTYTRPPSKSLIHFVIEAFKDLTILILLACATLSLGFGIKEHGLKEGWYDGGSIFVAVFLVVAVSAVSNFRQNRQFDKLSKVSSNIKIDVVRNGRRQEISIFDIVVGDIVCLNIGDQVPADGVFVEGHSLHVDESSMTGESDHVEVSLNGNTFLFSGTKVADGFGKMAVTSVGMNTAWGQMMSHISRDTNEQTPLQTRLDKLTSSIGKVGLLVAFLVLVVLLVRYFTGSTRDESGNREYNGKKTNSDEIVNAVVEMVAAAVTIIVVAIPEGLPLAVTLTLAYSMKRMMKDQAMVRKLSACETMGSATTICTDKTGTLTLNQMKVTDSWFGLEPGTSSSSSSLSRKVVELFHQGVAMNTTGSVFKANSGTEYEFSGSPTEKAILSWAVEELKMDMEEVIEEHDVVHVEAFNSEKKRSGVLLRKKKKGEITVVHWKGAAEKILAMCSTFCDGSGAVKEIDEDDKIKFEQIIQSMAAKSLRCIAFAYSEEEEEEKKKLKEENLTLLGIVGIKDPCRPGVKKAVEDCQFAGVSIKMITGDNIFTARAIAVECGILTQEDETNKEAVLEGEEFRNYTQQERLEKVERIKVMARSSPFDKLLMVKCLRELGHVVAVTGDGTNDAPALKEADIGLSMGIQGTEVAKESSDIVILDDNFASVATVLRWGRCVYNNIQKFIQFQLTVNVAALVINFVAAISAGEVPLTAVQLLWVNLIMDTLGALALATEKPTNDLMRKKPIGRFAPLITNVMWRNLLAQAFYQIGVLLVLQFRGRSIFGVNERVKNTLIFNTFVLCQVFNEFNARSLEKKNVFKGIHKNRLFVGIIVVTVVLQVVMVEFLKRFADTERLDLGQWGVCVAIAAASWPIGWLVKSVPVPEKHFFSYLKWKKRA